jgi:hypothetical protein
MAHSLFRKFFRSPVKVLYSLNRSLKVRVRVKVKVNVRVPVPVPVKVSVKVRVKVNNFFKIIQVIQLFLLPLQAI